MGALEQLIYILLTTDIVSGQLISGQEYTLLGGAVYGNNDNTIEILANRETWNLMALLNTTDGSELDGWYLECFRGVTLLEYWKTQSCTGNTCWWYYTTPDIFDNSQYIATTLHFRATLTKNPTTNPTTSTPTESTLSPTTSSPTPQTNNPTSMPSLAPTVWVYSNETDKLSPTGPAVSIYGQYAVIGDQAYGKMVNDAGSAGPGIAYIFDLNTIDNSYVSLTPTDNSYGDAFGMSVSIYGDYALISSAYFDRDYGDGHGKVYVYKRTNGNQWTQMTSFWPNIDLDISWFYFGQRVMLKQNYALIGTHRGISAYIFKKSDTSETWNQAAILTPDPNMGDDVWWDTLNEMFLDNTASYALIGYTNDANSRGKVFIFKRNNDETWTKINTLVSPFPGDNYNFGQSVTMYDNYIAISEAGYDNPIKKVYIYTIDKLTDNIVLTQTLTNGYFAYKVIMYEYILCITKTTNIISAYQRNVNNQFEFIRDFTTSDGGAIGNGQVLYERKLITTTGYIFDIQATKYPTQSPTTAQPTVETSNPTITPSMNPTSVTSNPTQIPTMSPSTMNPTIPPTTNPSVSPTLTTEAPTLYPSISPTQPSSYPTFYPTKSPTDFEPYGVISCDETITTEFISGWNSPRYFGFILHEVSDVTFSNCATAYDTRLLVLNEDLSVTVSIDYCDGDDCGSSLCTTYNANEIFTIPNMSPAKYYIQTEPYSTSYSGDYILEVQCVTPATPSPTVPNPTSSPITAIPTIPPDGNIFCNEELIVNFTQNDVIRTRYYRFSLEMSTQNVVFSNCETQYDTKLFVYDRYGTEISNTEGNCDGDDCGYCTNDNSNEEFTIAYVEAGEYLVQIEPYSSSNNGEYHILITCPTTMPTTSMPTNSPITSNPTQPTVNPTTRVPTLSTTDPTNRPSMNPTESPVSTTDSFDGNGNKAFVYDFLWSIVVVVLFLCIVN